MSIQFISFQTETNYDKLSVFSINADGTFDTANPLVNQHSNNQPPNGGAMMTGAAGSIGLKFQFTSDGSNNQVGWEALLWDSTLVSSGSPPAFVTVPIPVGMQLNPVASGGGGGASATGTFVIELDVDTK